MGEEVKEAALDLVPIYGTYRVGKRFVDNPTWGGAGNLALSAIGDIASVFGVGLLAKGAIGASKAGKIYKAANAANRAFDNSRLIKANDNLRSANRILKRDKDAVNSLTLMNASLSTILNRARKLNKSRANLIEATNQYNTANKEVQALMNNIKHLYELAQKLDFKPQGFLGLIGINPSVHAAGTATEILGR